MKILDIVFRLPDLWKPWFLVIFVVGSAIATAMLEGALNAASLFPLILAIVSVLFGGLSWFFMVSSAKTDEGKNDGYLARRNYSGLIFLGVGIIFAIVGLIRLDFHYLNWVLGIYCFVMLSLWPVILNRRRIYRVIAGGILLSGPFILTAVLLGDYRSGLFPAVLTTMLSWVAFWIRDLEERASQRPPEADTRIHLIFGKTLAWISSLLFVFGVISLWPWLGELYGYRYFWILVLGVLSPILFFWGRLRQPRTDDSKTALHRLSRVLPYCGVILLLAFLFG